MRLETSWLYTSNDQRPDLTDHGNFYRFCLIFTLPPSRPGQTRFAIIAYLAFLAVSLGPVIGETLIEFDSMSDRGWFEALYIAPMLYVLGPVVQILALGAFWSQASEMKRSQSLDDALSTRGLAVQAVVFLLVGISFVWRMMIPVEELNEHFIVNLRMWYWTVGWATIDNLIFAVVQGVLAWIAWRQRGHGGDVRERSALLE